MQLSHPTRRLLLAALAVPAAAGLGGCAAPLPEMANPGSAGDAQALLAGSARAHGLAALDGIEDISVSYAGEWGGLAGRLQPALVDAGFRGGSEERLLLRERLVAQAHTGPSGRKQVLRRTPRGVWGADPDGPGPDAVVRVWLNGVETADQERCAAAALVADGYSLFLLGPMLLVRRAAGGGLAVELAGAERVEVGGREHLCDVVRLRLLPGLGFSEADQVALYIDRPERLMRRVRFTLNGLDATRGAVAEVDAWEHLSRAGVRWPTRFHERLLRPLPLGVHDWRLTGLDVNRGLVAAEVSGMVLAGRAAVPAAGMTGGGART